MSLSLPMGPRQFTLLKNLGGDGPTEWDDLSFEEKELVYITGIDLTDKVDLQKIREFEKRRELVGEMQEAGPVRTVISRTRLALM